MKAMQEKILIDTQSEENVLACLMQNPRNIFKVLDILRPEHFMGDVRGQIYKIFVELARKGKTPSMPLVFAECEKAEIDVSRVAMISWGDSLATMGNIEDYAGLVVKKSTFRKLSYAAQEIVTMAMHEDEDALEKSEQLITDIARGAITEEAESFSDALDGYITDLRKKQADRKKGIFPGLRTGYKDIDRMIGGFMAGNMYVIAALTGGGKTFLAINMSLNIARAKKRCLFFSLEMTRNELMQRMVAREAKVEQARLRDAELEDAEIESMVERLEEIRHFQIDVNTTAYYFQEIKQAIRQAHMKKPLDIVFLDYFQLVQFTQNIKNNMQRAEVLAQMSRELKILAQQLNIPIVILAQVNREVEKRGNKEPQLSDLNESGGMGRDASAVIFIYAEDTEEIRQQKENGLAYPVYFRVAKSRHGSTGTSTLMFNGGLGLITEQVVAYQEEEGY